MGEWHCAKEKVLQAIPFVQTRVLSHRDMLQMSASFQFLEGEMDRMALQLRAHVYGGETRVRTKTVEICFVRPKTWVDALQLHLELKGFLCGGGLIGLLLYWWFLDRKVEYATETKSETVTFKARELFPELKGDRSWGHKCVIADWSAHD